MHWWSSTATASRSEMVTALFRTGGDARRRIKDPGRYQLSDADPDDVTEERWLGGCFSDLDLDYYLRTETPVTTVGSRFSVAVGTIDWFYSTDRA